MSTVQKRGFVIAVIGCRNWSYIDRMLAMAALQSVELDVCWVHYNIGCCAVAGVEYNTLLSTAGDLSFYVCIQQSISSAFSDTPLN